MNKSKAAIEFLSVVGQQTDALQRFEIGMRQDTDHQPGTEPPSAKILVDKDIADVRIRGKVGNNAGNPYLSLVLIQTEAQRISKRPVDPFPAQFLGPGSLIQKADNTAKVQLRRIGGDRELSPLPLERPSAGLPGHPSLHLGGSHYRF